jgi:NADH:ubiquinone oxidoreductase subunit K
MDLSFLSPDLLLAVSEEPQIGVFNLRNCLILSAFIFILGAWGVIARRNVLIMLISVELMLNAVNLAFASFARAHANLAADTLNPHAGQTGHIFALFIIAVAAAEAAVGLAIVITYFRNRESVDTRDMQILNN